jgi:hypothetical protein
MGVAPWLKVYIANEMCSRRFFMNISGFTGNSVRRPIFVLKNSFAIQHHGFEVVIRVEPLVTRASIPYFQIHDHL